MDAKLKALRDIEEGMEKCSDTYTVVLLTMAILARSHQKQKQKVPKPLKLLMLHLL